MSKTKRYPNVIHTLTPRALEALAHGQYGSLGRKEHMTYCRAEIMPGGMVCTLPKGHGGLYHAAGTGGFVGNPMIYEVWLVDEDIFTMLENLCVKNLTPPDFGA
jgi:hypothetical protein